VRSTREQPISDRQQRPEDLHGLVLERLDRLDDAIAALSKAVEADPDFRSARLRLGRLASRAGGLQCAADAYRGYLKAHPNDAHEWISLAIVLCDMRQIEDAEQAYWRAAGLEPSNVSLHFNWLISAQRAGDLERARDALKKLTAIAPQEWRTKVAEAYILEKSGDAVGAFRLGRHVFLDLIAERTDDASNKALDYVARRISEIALRSHDQFPAEAEEFVGDLFAEEIFTDETLVLIRALEQPKTSDLFAHALQIEALYRDQDEPFACFVNYRVLARDKEEAAAFAQRFEERCGANDVCVRLEEVEQLDACEGPTHAGVCWRSGRMSFPADEFGTDD
jgi:tetratricopeptide (TPR) repeat protein